MPSGKKGVKQPILSRILLAVLGTIGVSIFSIHSSFEPAPPPAFLKDLTIPSVDSSTGLNLTLSSLPQFEKGGPQEKYDRETLFEKINGKAPLYLNSGYVELITQRFIQKDDSQQWFELYLYDMATDTNAFSVFSTQRRPDTSQSAALATLNHYLTENGLYLQLGRYYFEVIGSSENTLLQEAMITSVRTVLTENTIKTADIRELALFPKDDLNPHSIKLYLADTFGSEALTNTFVGQYIIEDLSINGYISNQNNRNQAKQVAENYYQFLIDSGGTPLADNDESIKYVDLFGTIESISQVGPYVFGVHEGEDLESARLISKRLRKRLQKQIQP